MDTKWARQNVRLVAYAWGRQYVDDLLDFALAAALAPGNLPALAAVFECTAVIVTEEKLFDYVRAHPTIKKLKQICRIELVPLDDLVSDPWQYGITVAYALFRGFEDLGSAMTDTYILFLNADFILADRCYEKLIERIRSAERVHLAPSYCTVEEEMRPLLRRARNKNGGILAISAPDMAALILRRPHNTVRAKTINQPVFEFEYADQFYWKVDSHTLIGHQMPVALVGMRPERALTDLNTFWDWGIVYEFCPSKQLNVIGDSDDFLMMELRSKNRSINSIRLGRSSPKQISKRLTGHITQYQLDNAQFELRLHSRELPLGLAEARRQLRARVKEVLRHLPSMSDHRWHRQWIYHLRHYRWRLERKWICSRVERITSEIAVAQSRLSKERELIDEYLPDEDREQALQYLDAEYADNLQELRHQLARLENRLQAPIQAADWIFRRIAGAPWVYRLSRRRLRNWIKQAAGNGTLRILAVCQPYSLLFGLFEQIPGCHMHLTPESVINGSLQLLPQASPRFDLCIVELGGFGETDTKQFLNAVTEHLTQPGTMFIYWDDRGSVPLQSVHSQIVQLTLHRAFDARAWFAGSWASSRCRVALVNSAFRNGLEEVLGQVLGPLRRYHSSRHNDCDNEEMVQTNAEQKDQEAERDTELSDGTAETEAGAGEKKDETDDEAEEEDDYNYDPEYLATGWFTDPEVKGIVSKILRQFQLDESAIEAEAIKCCLPHLRVLDKMLCTLEARLNKTLRCIAEYRESLARQLRESADRIIEGRKNILALEDPVAKLNWVLRGE